MNWTITLCNRATGNIKTTITTLTGAFRFDNVSFGSYWLNETPRSGWSQQTPNITVTLDETNQLRAYTFVNNDPGLPPPTTSLPKP